MTLGSGRGGWGGVASHCVALASVFAGCGGTVELRTDEVSRGGATASNLTIPSSGTLGDDGDEDPIYPKGGSLVGGSPSKMGEGNPSGGEAPESGGEAPISGGETSIGGSASTATGALAVLKSSGCGRPLPATQVGTIPGSRTGYTEFHVTATGATLIFDDPTHAGERQFFVRVPADYDEKRAYRVVYVASGCGSPHTGNTSTYPLFSEPLGGAEQAVYVGLSLPENSPRAACYDQDSGAQSQEWEAFDLIHAFVESTYCVDNNRIYVAGYSSGASLANMWGCYFAGTPSPPLDGPDLMAQRTERKFSPTWAIRGHLGTAGSGTPDEPQPCNGPAAGFWLHDTGDTSQPLAKSIAALDLSLKTNGCVGDYANGPKQPWAPAEQIPGLGGGICQQYTGCSSEMNAKYPLVFCTTDDSMHDEQAGRATPAFTQFMDLLDPAE